MLLASLVAACDASEKMRPPARMGCGPAAPDAEDDIREAALRYLLTEPCGREGVDFTGSPRICIATESDTGPVCPDYMCDPSLGFLERFATQRPPVSPVSACDIGFDRVVDPKAGSRAVVFTTGDICWVGNATVELDAGELTGLSSEMTFKIKLFRRSGKWRVDSCEVTSVS